MKTAVQSRDAFLALSRDSAIGAAVCGAVSAHQIAGVTETRNLCTLARISQAKSGAVQQFLQRAAAFGLFEQRTEFSWEPLQHDLHAVLAPMFQGVALYLEHVHGDKDMVDVVITKPPAPSRFDTELQAVEGGDWGLFDTKEALPAIAEAATRRLRVMTPFVDRVGASILLNLFGCAGLGVNKLLITRSDASDVMPAGLVDVLPELRALNVVVLNFRVGRPSSVGDELSHAKVVLADDVMAYVGSLNMNRWSFEYSLELGVRVRGVAATHIARVMTAAERASAPFREPDAPTGGAFDSRSTPKSAI